ncbi:MAG TPA: arginase family protein [Polyangiaceae bacterium]
MGHVGDVPAGCPLRALRGAARERARAGLSPDPQGDVFGALRAADGGNVAVPPFAPALARDVIENEIASIVRAGAVPFAVGGDHSIALPAMRAVAKKHGPLVVVHVDAHLDTSDAEVWGDAFHHGTPLRHAIEEGLVAVGQLHQVAVRAPWGYPEEGALAADHGATLYDVDAISARGIASVAQNIVACAGERPVYVTFDVDGVDPAFAPGTGTPVPGGISSREAIALLRGLAGVNLVGMDVVEVCPALDHADVTSHLAAHLVFEGLALAAVARERARSGS